MLKAIEVLTITLALYTFVLLEYDAFVHLFLWAVN